MENIVFLHSQLSGYFLSSILHSLDQNFNIHVTMIVNPNSSEAPFDFQIKHERFTLFNRKELNESGICQIISELSPKLIVLSGWDDKTYLSVASKYKKKASLTILMDNLWYGQFRQYLGLIYSRLFLVPLFDFIWVPGQPQKKFAKKLGFKESQILINSYCADLNKFTDYYNKSINIKVQHFPHKFLYVGRYVSQKGLDNLWKAFVNLQKEYPNDWELVCVGSGPLYESRMIADNIIHRGFIQPEDFQQVISETGVFVLPSWEEHWGVVLHEYASAGYPLICSNEVGASSTFLKDKVNGYLFESKNIESLKEKMLNIVNTTDSELLKMGKASVLMSKEVTNEKWNDSFTKAMKT
jgi:glycosyltransferase involved in cell wall biosynthesis